MGHKVKVVLLQSETRIIGGVERVTEALLACNQWEQVEPYVIFLRPGLLAEHVSEFFPQERTAVIDAGRLRQAHKAVGTVLKISRQLQRWKADVVISQGFHAQCYGALAAKFARTKNIFWGRALVPTQWARGVKKKKVKNIFWGHEFMEQDVNFGGSIGRLAMLMPADLILANSQATLENFQQFYNGRRDVKLLSPSVDLQRFLTVNGSEHLRNEIDLKPDAFVVTLIGRLQKWKGQETFLKAAALVSEKVPLARFLLVGGPTFTDEQIYENSLREQARELGIEDRVTFMGHRDDIPNVMAASDVFVHASTEPEPFGVVIVEAMAAGKPVIATHGGGPEEIVLDGHSGFLVPARDADSLANKLLALFADPALRSRMGEEGRRRAVERFSQDQLIQNIEALVKELMQ